MTSDVAGKVIPFTGTAGSDPADRVCVIGAGSAGIAMCRALALRDIPFDCFERRDGVGGLWRYSPGENSCAYASLAANTSKTVMEYPSFPMPDDMPDYPHHTHVARYFDAYVDEHGLREHIRFGTDVTRVEQAEDGGWTVTLADGTSHRYRAVLVASGGRHGVPAHAGYEGTFTGRELHSFEYDGPEEFAGKTVVVLGLGATSADIATEVSRVAKATHLAVRTGHYVVPKILEGRPIDKLSPFMKKLSVEQRRPLLSLMIKLVHGDMSAYGLPSPPYKPGQGPLISTSEFLPGIVHGRISPKPVVESVQGRTVRFADGQTVEADVLIHCTGYRIAYPFLDDEIVGDGDDAPPLYQMVVPPEIDGLYFVGLVHSMTSLMPVAEHQSEWIGDLLTGAVTLPPRGHMWSAIRRSRRRQDKRFHDSSGHLLVDPREYQRLLETERRTFAAGATNGAAATSRRRKNR